MTQLAPYFSIIIPVYNVETYLNQCVNSILSQDFSDFEVILVNDGSKDTSGIICDNYSKEDKRIKVVHQENSGVSMARNAGIELAQGKYVWFVDSDDWIAEHALSILHQNLEKDNLDVISFTYTNYFEINKSFTKPENSNEIQKTNGYNFVLNTNSFFQSLWVFVYKKSFLNEHELLFKKNQIHEDDYFNLCCFGKIQNIKKISEELYFYRRGRDGSITSTFSISHLITRINSYINLIVLCEEIKDLNKDVLEKQKEEYRYVLYDLLIIYCLKETFYKIEYALLKNAKKAIGNIQISKSDYAGSKVALVTKISFNLNILCFIFFNKILKSLKFRKDIL